MLTLFNKRAKEGPRISTLRKLSPFGSLSRSELRVVDSLLHERRYLKGEIVFDEGEEGQALYVDQCELCHGRAGAYELSVPEGAGVPHDLGDPAFQHSVTDAELDALIRNGRHGMPVPWPIAAKEMTSLIAFVRLLSPGYALYDRYCANCHGDDGRGTGTLAEADARPTVRFLHRISSGA